MPIISVKNIKKSFSDGVQVLKDISFDVEQGEILGIIGPSGSGKSTMLRCIAQLETVDDGSIFVCDKPIVQDGVYAGKKDLREIGLNLGFVFQNFNLFPHMSVLQNITDAQIHVLKTPKDEAVAVARKLLSDVGLSEKENAYPCELSGGQQQRVLLARALCATQKMLFLDEPVSALDPAAQQEMYDLIENLNKEGITIIMISHDVEAALNYATHVLHIGESIFFGTKERFIHKTTCPDCNGQIRKIIGRGF